MSACWPSERGAPRAARRALAAWLALCGLAVSPMAAAARVHVGAVDSTGDVSRISISERGVVVERGGSRDTSYDWTNSGRRDEDRHRVRTRVRASGPVLEVDEGGTGIVRIWSDAEVPAGKVVDGDAVAVFGSVTVAGEVQGNVVAVMGSVHLKPGAKVEGDVVSIGGVLDQADGVTINGESVQLGFTPFTWGLPGLSVLLFSVAAGWLVSMFVGWIGVLLFPTAMLRVATTVERRPAASFFLGLLSVPAFFVAAALLCITVIGIPLAVLLPMAYGLIGYLGQLAATGVLGARLSRRPLHQGMMTPILAGTLFVAIILAIGIVLMGGGGVARPMALFLTLSGTLLVLGMGALGTGAFLLSRFGSRPRDVVWQGQASPGPGGLPSPIPPPVTP